MTDSEDRNSPPEELPRFQFSLRSQLIAVTLVALLLGVIVTGGDTVAWLVFYALIYCLLPTPFVIGAVFGRGKLRAFCVGALVPCVAVWQINPMTMVLYRQNLTQPTMLLLMVGSAAFVVVTAAACGALAVISRRWLERLGQD